jgi:ABC-type oligopeptide transport system substrate-binding subunit
VIRSTFAALAVAFLLGLSGCSNSSDNVADTLVYARNRDAVNLDPALAPDGMSLDVVHSMMEGLVSYKPGSFDVQAAPCGPSRCGAM